MNKKNLRKGFTTVELVIVIAVIAILATALIPTFGGLIDKANETKYLQAARTAYNDYLLANASNSDFDADADLAIHSGTKYYEVKGGVFDSTGKDSTTITNVYCVVDGCTVTGH